MKILENIGYIAGLVNRYEPLFNEGLLTEAAIDDVAGLDSSLSDLDKQVDSLQGAVDTYVDIFAALASPDALGGADLEAQEASKECVEKLTAVRGQLDDIAQLDMGAIKAIGDFFGKDSSYKKGLEDLVTISQELSKVHAISAGSAAAAARLMKRAKLVKMDDESVGQHSLTDPNNGFFAKNDLEFKDVLKQVERSAKKMIPGTFAKMGGFFKGLVRGEKAKPLFGLSADLITRSICGVKGSKFNDLGKKIVGLGNDISKFGESLAKYKKKEVELKKLAVSDKKANDKQAQAVEKIENVDLQGRDFKEKYSARLDTALGKVSPEQKEDVKSIINSFATDFDKMVAEARNVNSFSMNLDFLSETQVNDDGNLTEEDEEAAESATGLSEEEFEALENELTDSLIDGVEDIDAETALNVAQAMLESTRRQDVRRRNNFYNRRHRALALAGIKGKR